MKLEIVPRKLIGDIQLGANGRSVHTLLGRPESTQEPYTKWNIDFCRKDFYFDSALQLGYGQDNNAGFVEVSSDSRLTVIFNGNKLHVLCSNDIIDKMTSVASVDKTDAEYPESCIYPQLVLSLWTSSDKKTKFESVGVEGYFTV